MLISGTLANNEEFLNALYERERHLRETKAKISIETSRLLDAPTTPDNLLLLNALFTKGRELDITIFNNQKDILKITVAIEEQKTLSKENGILK